MMATIRSMQTPADLDFAAGLTIGEGWASEVRSVFEGFFAYDPNGCFIAEADDQRVGIAVATHYGENGFIGEIIVVPELRGQGIGRQLLDHAVNYLHRRRAHNVLLDGVLRAVPLYERAGFRRVCRSLRFQGRIPGRASPRARAMHPEDLPAVKAIDRLAFGDNRGFFLERRLRLYPDLCQVLEEDENIRAFILGRRMASTEDQPGGGMLAVGPWVVAPGVENPAELIESLAIAAGENDLTVGVLEKNERAAELLRSYGLVERQGVPWRMVLGFEAYLGASEQCYAIGSAAKG
jgi:GNAT superfamily N-acetyltransferase